MALLWALRSRHATWLTPSPSSQAPTRLTCRAPVIKSGSHHSIQVCGSTWLAATNPLQPLPALIKQPVPGCMAQGRPAGSVACDLCQVLCKQGNSCAVCVWHLSHRAAQSCAASHHSCWLVAKVNLAAGHKVAGWWQESMCLQGVQQPLQGHSWDAPGLC